MPHIRHESLSVRFIYNFADSPSTYHWEYLPSPSLDVEEAIAITIQMFKAEYTDRMIECKIDQVYRVGLWHEWTERVDISVPRL